MDPVNATLLAWLPVTFRYRDALEQMSERQLRKLVSGGQVTRLSRGLYRQSGWLGDDDLVEIAVRSAKATICLRSALARHGLTDEISAEFDIAIPRGTWVPRTAVPVRWRGFDPGTFTIGRQTVDVGAGRQIGIYCAERSIVDEFRLRHLEGADLANEALKQWLCHGGQPSELLRTARVFPRVLTTVRETLQILL